MTRPGQFGATMAALFFLVFLFGLIPPHTHADTRGITVKARTGSGTTRDLQLYSGYHALVVGCGDYRAGWPRLPNPVSDARDVASTLEKMGCEVDLLTDPDWATLRRSLNKLITGPGRDRDKAILFWFSGHGHTLKEAGGRELGYIVPVDAPNPDRDEIGFMEHAISMRQIETLARRIRSRHTLMLFDSCFSGAIFQAVRSKPSRHIEEKVQKPVRQFITAGNKDEQVPDESVFKTVFIQGIEEGYADRNTDGYVTGMELGDYLQEQVINYSRGAQHPQFGKINDPELDKGDFVFHLASSGAVIDAPTHQPNTQGRLSVTSNMTGAKVYVDGRYIGETPLPGIEVKAGTHRVKVEKSGYDNYDTTISIDAGRSASLEAYLSLQPSGTGRLYVHTSPGNATVKVLNIRPKFYQGMALEPGSYHVAVSAGGYEKQSRWVKLLAGEDKRIDFQLPTIVVSPPALNGEPRLTNSLGMEFVYIAPGIFRMGSPPNEPERDRDERPYQVTLTNGYYMQTTEVTQGQWKKVMGNNPSKFKDCGNDCPVEMVSWFDVQAFIRKLKEMDGTHKYRLPTEAEWEYACRAGTKTPFFFGVCLSSDQSNYYGELPMPKCSKGRNRETTVYAGSFPANDWGLYDMHGNVLEWCQDWYGEYPYGSANDPKGPASGSFRVSRGGSWFESAKTCRSSKRSHHSLDKQFSNLGFRLAVTP